MTLLGRTSPALNSVVCSKFQPTVLEGQLCYTLNLSSLRTEKSRAGQRDGLMIVIDQGMAHVRQQETASFKESKEDIKDMDL